jgi:uncharacterized protein (UPF0332 family)
MKSDAELYLRKSRAFLEDGTLLFSKARYARCAGCAYYAMFHAAQAILVNEGVEAHTHEGVKTKFGEIFVKQRKAIAAEFGRMLSRVHDFRLDADYSIDLKSEVGQEGSQATA